MSIELPPRRGWAVSDLHLRLRAHDARTKMAGVPKWLIRLFDAAIAAMKGKNDHA